MTIAYWIVTGLATAVFLLVGLMKLARPKEALAASGLNWTEDFPGWAVKLIGAAEVLGAIGLVAPRLTDILPVLGPIAALALAALMLGAVVTHLRRTETFVPPLVLSLLSIAAAVLGFLTL